MSRKITCPPGQGVVLPLQGTDETDRQKVPGTNDYTVKQVLPLGEAGPKGLKGQGMEPRGRKPLMISLP